MKIPAGFVPLFFLSALSAFSAPIGICLHAYSPEAPRDKIECFEFERVEKLQASTRYFLPGGRSVVVTDYRNRGTILYPNPQQTAPGRVEELLKNYEEQAGGTPSVRPFLNPWILKLRQSKDQAARVEQEDSKLPTVTLASGISYTACSLKGIEGDVVSIRHKDGFGKVPLTELDAAEKSALAATNTDWSFDTPGITPKDKTGVFPRIVFRNGAQILKSRFKEYADGVLVFVTDGRNRTFSPDLFPAELSVLGSDVEKAVASAPPKDKSSDGVDLTTGTQGDGLMGALQSYNDGSMIQDRIKQVETETQKALADLEQKLVTAKKEHETLEAEFTHAGGKERIEQIREDAGHYRSFRVQRTLADSGFEKLSAKGESVYEVVFIDGTVGIVVTPEVYPTGKRAELYLKSGGRVDVKLTNGLTDKREVFQNSPLDGEDKAFDEIRKKLSGSETRLAELEEQSTKMSNRAGLAIEALRVAARRLAAIRPCNLVVSPKLGKRGFSASIQDRNHAAAVAALKSGDLVAIAGLIGAKGSANEIESLIHFKPDSTTAIPSVARINELFNSIESMKFRVGLITNDPRYDRGTNGMDASFMAIPAGFVSRADLAEGTRAFPTENPFLKKSGDNSGASPAKSVFGGGLQTSRRGGGLPGNAHNRLNKRSVITKQEPEVRSFQLFCGTRGKWKRWIRVDCRVCTNRNRFCRRES